MNHLDIIKIGWENAGTDLQTTGDFVKSNHENAQVLVVSAMRDEDFNSTDELKNTAELLKNSDLEWAKNNFLEILNFHKTALEKQNLSEIIPEIEKIFLDILACFENNSGKNISLENDFSIFTGEKYISLLGFWEEISALVHARLLESHWLESQVVDTNNIKISDSNTYTHDVREYFSPDVKNILSLNKVPVVPGFIGNIPGGILQNIDRWYTDATASLVALSQNEYFKSTRLNIFKSVDGILACDPRLFSWDFALWKNEKIDLISHMDYLTARELTGGSIGWKAKFLHEYALSQDIMKAWIELKIVNPKFWDLWTTVNKNKNQDSQWVEIVNKRENISFVKITKAAFSEWVGDVEKIFEIVRQKGFSIDMIITSETQVSFSLEAKDISTLSDLQKTLETQFFNNETSQINKVEIENNMALIHCIWQNLDDSYQLSLAKWILALEDIWVKIHHFWGEREKGAIIFAIEEKNANICVRKLAREFNLINTK